MKAVTCFLAAVLAALPVDVAGEVTSKEIKRYRKSIELLVRGDRRQALKSLIEEMARRESPELAPLILVAGTAIPSQDLYRTAGKAISRLKNPEAVAAFAQSLRRKELSYRQKVLVLEGFARRHDDVSLHAALEAVRGPIVHVQLAAIDALRRHRRKEAIPVLIDVLEEFQPYRDRTWYEARSTLISLTGQAFEEIADWRKFWDGVGADFDPKILGKKKTASSMTEVKKIKASVDFFGSEIFSRNVVFVVDVSGSMTMYDEGDYDGHDVERQRERLFRSKKHVAGALKKLPRSANFNVIAFSNKVFSWQKTLQPATKGRVASAIKFVASLKANEATHTDDALKNAFRDLRVDTVILLSDGAPVRRDKGTRDDRSSGLIREILEWVKNVNAGRRVRIDTFGFRGRGTWPTNSKYSRQPYLKEPQIEQFVRFLKTLAKSNQGRFRAID